jgi:hypothetical protein
MRKTAGIADPGTRPDRRRSPRHRLCLDAQLRPVDEATSPGTVMEISQTGFLLQAKQPMKTGETFQLDLPQSSHSARIIWTCGLHSGCEFDQPLSKAALSAALLKARPAKKGEGLPAQLQVSQPDEPKFVGEVRLTPTWLWLVLFATPALWLLAMAIFIYGEF